VFCSCCSPVYVCVIQPRHHGEPDCYTSMFTYVHNLVVNKKAPEGAFFDLCNPAV